MIIKEVKHREGADPRIVLREDNYDSRLSKFDALYEIAWQDFYSIERDAVTITHYGGDTHKHQWGIEFNWRGAIPPEYVEVRELLPTL